MTANQGKHLTNEQRYSIIDMVYNYGKTLAETAAQLKVNYKTAHRVCTTFERENRIDKKQSKGRSTIYNSPVKRKIEKFFQAKPDATLAACKLHLENTQDQNNRVPCVSTIDRILRKSHVVSDDRLTRRQWLRQEHWRKYLRSSKGAENLWPTSRDEPQSSSNRSPS